MKEYRIYCLDAAGHILDHAYFEAEGDEQAMLRAEEYDPTTQREIWHDHRKVVLLTPRMPGV